jgi:hypothetical protein
MGAETNGSFNVIFFVIFVERLIPDREKSA